MVNDHSLQKMVNAPTRDKHVLDIFLTNNPTLVNISNIIPGISDHDTVQININVAPRIVKQKPRTISLYKKVDWERMKVLMQKYHQERLKVLPHIWSNGEKKVNFHLNRKKRYL